MATSSTESGLTSHEYFNQPPVDIRITARWCYFDIELPGVTAKEGINIHWISPQAFLVEGEIPRPVISIRDELDDNPTVMGWKNCAGKPVDPPTGLISLTGGQKQEETKALINGSVVPNADTTSKPPDNYPGFSHLLRCPGSGIHGDDNARREATSNPGDKYPGFSHLSRCSGSGVPHDDDTSHASLISTDPEQAEEDQERPGSTAHHAPPLDEVALIHSRSTSSSFFSRRHKPHNDHDTQPATNGFQFLSNHNEDQSPTFQAPGNKISKSSTPPNDVLRPIANGDEPQLVLGERLIGTYKRLCTIPGDGAVKVYTSSTETKLEAGVLTVRVPRRWKWNEEKRH